MTDCKRGRKCLNNYVNKTYKLFDWSQVIEYKERSNIQREYEHKQFESYSNIMTCTYIHVKCISMWFKCGKMHKFALLIGLD